MKLKILIVVIYSAYCLNLFPGNRSGEADAQGVSPQNAPVQIVMQINTSNINDSINYEFSETRRPTGN